MGTTEADKSLEEAGKSVEDATGQLEYSEAMKKNFAEDTIAAGRKLAEDKKNHLNQEPVEQKAPAHPRHEFNNKMVIWSSVLSLVAIAGSRGMKTGANGAMSALTAALNGVMEGNEMAYKMHMDNYRGKIQEINAAHKKEMAVYEKQLAMHDVDEKEWLMETNLQLKILGEEVVRDRLALEKRKEAKERLVQKMNGAHTTSDHRTGGQKERDAAIAALAKEGKKNQSDEVIAAKVKAMFPSKSAKDSSLPPRVGGRGAIFSKALEDAKSKNKGVSEADIIAALKAKGFDETK